MVGRRRQRLEDCLGEIVVGLTVVAAAIKKDRRDTEEAHRRREEERKQAEEERRRAEEHKRKAEFVTELMQNWEEADRLRKFAKAMEQSAAQLELSDDEKRDVQQVVDWTGKYAEFLDPLFDLPDSIAEFAHPEIAYPWLR